MQVRTRKPGHPWSSYLLGFKRTHRKTKYIGLRGQKVTEEKQSVALRLIIFFVQAFVATACTLCILLFAAMYVAAMVQSPSSKAQSACTEENPDFPWCWPPVSSYAQEENPPISEARRRQLRTALLRAFPEADSHALIDRPTTEATSPGAGIKFRQAESFSCSKIGPAALLQERATITFEEVKPNCLVPDPSTTELHADRSNFYAYGCGAPDWCPDNGRLPPIGVKLPPLDHPRTHCAGRPLDDLRKIKSQKTCDNETLIVWAKRGDATARLIFYTRFIDLPNYANDPIIHSISNNEAFLWLVQAAMPAENFNPNNAPCANSGAGVRDATCANFGFPEAQIRLAAEIYLTSDRSPGWDEVAKELINFASANGQPDAAEQVLTLVSQATP